MKIGILGGGISGLTLAAHLKQDYELLEKNQRCGGHAASLTEEGFTFDIGGAHIMFSRNEEVLHYEVSLLGDNVLRGRRNNKVFFKGRFVKYPFENGLYELAPDDRFECLYYYIQNNYPEPSNFKEWMYYTFGKGITERYLLPYNEKIWKTPAEEMSLHWVNGRVPKPPVEDVIKSAVGIETEGYTHQLNFYYPKRGGFQALCDVMEAKAKNVVKNAAVKRIEKRNGQWEVSGTFGRRRYDKLVSTIPVQELLKAMDSVPLEVLRASERLQYNSLITVNLGLGMRNAPTYTAVYFPQSEYLFNRISFLKSFSPFNAPEGKSLVQAEITVKEGDEVWNLSDAELIDHVEESLDGIGLIDRRTVCYRRVIRSKYAYIIYDLQYQDNIRLVKEYMESIGVILLGRFSQFEYINSDVCVERSLKLATQLNSQK